MRSLSVFALAAVFAFVPFAVGEDKKELKRPPLDAKEWKKEKSGLEIWDVKEGKGTAAKAGDTVVVHYTGWLTDEKATKFDSSKDRNETLEVILKPGTPKSVIKGWNDGVPGMKPGGVRRLKIPAELAYGEEGRGKIIPPNSVLVFEVELIEVK